MTVQEAAREALQHFTTAERGDDRIDVMAETAPEWVRDLVYSAHGDFLPDDWRYRWIVSALEHIADTDDSDEWADDAVSVYTSERLQWLSSNLKRPGYVDQATDEWGPWDDIVRAIGTGQYMEATEVYASVLSSLEGFAGRDD